VSKKRGRRFGEPFEYSGEQKADIARVLGEARGDPLKTEEARRVIEKLTDAANDALELAFSYPIEEPLFQLLDTGSTPLVWLAVIVALVFAHAPIYGSQAAFLSELFGTRIRYSGTSLGSQLSSVIAGGLSPFIATALLP
jgi:hypothetical protein